jgi:hypothetical protein
VRDRRRDVREHTVLEAHRHLGGSIGALGGVAQDAKVDEGGAGEPAREIDAVRAERREAPASRANAPRPPALGGRVGPGPAHVHGMQRADELVELLVREAVPGVMAQVVADLQHHAPLSAERRGVLGRGPVEGEGLLDQRVYAAFGTSLDLRGVQPVGGRQHHRVAGACLEQRLERGEGQDIFRRALLGLEALGTPQIASRDRGPTGLGAGEGGERPGVVAPRVAEPHETDAQRFDHAPSLPRAGESSRAQPLRDDQCPSSALAARCAGLRLGGPLFATRRYAPNASRQSLQSLEPGAARLPP